MGFQFRCFFMQLHSTRFVVKPEGVSNVFLIKPVGVNENLGVEETREEFKPSNKSSPAATPGKAGETKPSSNLYLRSATDI